ncbi:hypothetical protein BBJ28_00015743 [Nothophytophthora sp. Chile5]|nr:hypothetical protein BBJ28_00015743 [Nothophytophthora sp. Chile5]
MSEPKDSGEAPPLAVAAQQWNWAALSQKSSDAGHSGSASRPSHRKQQTRGASTKRPLLLNTAGATSKTQQEQRQRHSRANAAAAIAQNGGDHGSNLGNADSEAMETYSGLRISDRTVSAQELRDEMEGRKYIHLGQMDLAPKDTFTNGTTDWVTIGVLIRKTLSKPTANGSTFMVWGLSDLNGTELGVFLFDDAYAAHWKELVGSVVALMNAALLPATEKNKFAFKASQRAEIVKLGKAVDFGICKGVTSGEARCRLAVNTAKVSIQMPT